MDAKERSLWDTYHADRSDENRNVLVELHYALAYKVGIKIFLMLGRPGWTSCEELVCEATPGLIRAVELFDITKGFAFSTYAVACMKRRVGKFLDERGETPSHLSAEIKAEIRGRRVSLAALEAVNRQPAKRDPERTILVSNWLEKLKRFLPARDHQILMARYGDGGRTLEEAGVVLGISRERIRQIEARAIKRLQRYTESQLLFENERRLTGIEVSELPEDHRPKEQLTVDNLDPIKLLDSLTVEQVREKMADVTALLSAWKQIEKIVVARSGSPAQKPRKPRAAGNHDWEPDIKAVRDFLSQQDSPVDARTIGDATGVKWPKLRHVIDRMDDVVKDGNSFRLAE